MTKRWVDRSIEAAALGILRANAIVHNGWQFALGSNVAYDGLGNSASCPIPSGGSNNRLVSTTQGLFAIGSPGVGGPIRIYKSTDGFEAYTLVMEAAGGRMNPGFDTPIDCRGGRMIAVEYCTDQDPITNNTNQIFGSTDGGDNWTLLFTTAANSIRHWHAGHYDVAYGILYLYSGDNTTQCSICICNDVDDLIANPNTWKVRWGLDQSDRSTIDTDYVRGYNDQKWRLVTGAIMGDYFYWGADSNAAVGVPLQRIHRSTGIYEQVIVEEHSDAAQNGNMVGECWGAGLSDTGEFLTVAYGHAPGAPYYGDNYRHLYLVDNEGDGLTAREIHRTRVNPSFPYALAYSIHSIGGFTVVSDYAGFSVSLAGNVSDEEGEPSMFTSLASLSSGAASHGKNFQQFFDGGSGGYRSGAYSDLVTLAGIITRYSGNTFTNLLALALRLSTAQDIQDELSHTSSTLRAAAASEMSTLITDLNALQVSEGQSAGDYSALVTAFNRCLAAGAPNDMGSWSERLTTAQITAANVALSAIGSLGTSLGHWLHDPELLMLADYGVTYEGTGTGTGGGVGVSAWANKGSVAGSYIQAAEARQPGYLTDQVNGHAALTFHGATDPRYLMANAFYPLTGTTGYLAFVHTVNNDAATKVLFGYGLSSTGTSYAGIAAASNEAMLWMGYDNPTSYTSHAWTGGVALTPGSWYLTEYIWNPTTGHPEHYINGTNKPWGAGNVPRWFGSMPTLRNRSGIGSLPHNSPNALAYNGNIACIFGKDGWSLATHPTEIAEVRAALKTRYGIA